MKKIIYIILGFFLSCLLFLCILTFLFLPILTTDSLIFPYALNPFDICKLYPDTWYIIKILYFCSFILCYLIIYIYIINNILKHQIYIKHNKILENPILDTSKVHLKIGTNENNTITYIGEKRLISKYFNYWNYWKR